MKSNSKTYLRSMLVTAIMSGIAFVLMLCEFGLPLIPGFLKFDLSDLPALISSFALGPLWGCTVELVKNVLHLSVTTTSGVGELANFLIGSAFVIPAGWIYKQKKGKKQAVIGALVGTIVSVVISFPTNYFITYPFFSKFLIPMETIIKAYSVLIPPANTLPRALLIVNCPLTLVKGLCNMLITLLLYKKISPILKGKQQ